MWQWRLMRIHGGSMAPTLRDGELVLIDGRAYTQRRPRRGEIVAARPRASGCRALVKRVVGLPRERVAVDGRRWQLGEGEFFLLGDATEFSVDSRRFGPVSREELVGPVRARLWPWQMLAKENTGGQDESIEVS